MESHSEWAGKSFDKLVKIINEDPRLTLIASRILERTFQTYQGLDSNLDDIYLNRAVGRELVLDGFPLLDEELDRLLVNSLNLETKRIRREAKEDKIGDIHLFPPHVLVHNWKSYFSGDEADINLGDAQLAAIESYERFGNKEAEIIKEAAGPIINYIKRETARKRLPGDNAIIVGDLGVGTGHKLGVVFEECMKKYDIVMGLIVDCNHHILNVAKDNLESVVRELTEDLDEPLGRVEIVPIHSLFEALPRAPQIAHSKDYQSIGAHSLVTFLGSTFVNYPLDVGCRRLRSMPSKYKLVGITVGDDIEVEEEIENEDGVVEIVGRKETNEEFNKRLIRPYKNKNVREMSLAIPRFLGIKESDIGGLDYNVHLSNAIRTFGTTTMHGLRTVVCYFRAISEIKYEFGHLHPGNPVGGFSSHRPTTKQMNELFTNNGYRVISLQNVEMSNGGQKLFFLEDETYTKNFKLANS